MGGGGKERKEGPGLWSSASGQRGMIHRANSADSAFGENWKARYTYGFALTNVSCD